MAEGGTPTPYIRANLRDMAPWYPTASLPSEHTGQVHRMDLNECPYPPSPAVVAAMQRGISITTNAPEKALAGQPIIASALAALPEVLVFIVPISCPFKIRQGAHYNTGQGGHRP